MNELTTKVSDNHTAQMDGLLPVKRRLFGGGWRRPITDEFGNKWCNCDIPNLVSNHGFGKGQAYCLRCKEYWYH